MPIIKLTDTATAITPGYALEHLWEMEILAHSLYPQPNAGAARRYWVERIQRKHAQDLTSRVSPRPIPGEFHRHWSALHGLTHTEDGLIGFKANKNRDLKFAANVLILCALEHMSKAKAISKLATIFLAEGKSNSLHSAETTIKRAWRSYYPACHFIAGFAMLTGGQPNETAETEPLDIKRSIAIGERLRECGETTIPPHGTRPILDASQTWSVPTTYSLPVITKIDWSNGGGSVKFA